ncbi:MAG: GDP-mannose 4,6-dehydratase [Candidatus Sericytochromatia bacterium]|nr:GDP-mannose 4,6-dehydratase [Candidatus Tanganyikabacteria bacterium]
MKVLITGGAGFIGSHLADALIERGDEVYVIDDLSTGSLDNVVHLRGNPRFHLVVDSVLNEAILNELVNRVDQVYHMAAVVGVKLVVESPVRTLETNIKGTEIVLQLCHRFNKKVFIASTSEVYGRHHENRPLCENFERIYGPTTVGRWSYATSKAIDEFLAFAYHREHGLDVVVARFFNTVGPRQTGAYGMVIPRFVKWALGSEPITVYGDGTQSRSFTYVGDAVWAATHLMDCPEAVGELFNIGNGAEISILELAETVKAMTGSKSEIRFVPYESVYGQDFEDMEFRTPSIEKLSRYTGYRPTLNLEGILRRVIAYFEGKESDLARLAGALGHSNGNGHNGSVPESLVSSLRG